MRTTLEKVPYTSEEEQDLRHLAEMVICLNIDEDLRDSLRHVAFFFELYHGEEGAHVLYMPYELILEAGTGDPAVVRDGLATLVKKSSSGRYILVDARDALDAMVLCLDRARKALAC